MTSLLALIHPPSEVPEERAALERVYADTHLPLIASVPGLRSLTVHRIRRRLMGESDAMLATTMRFDDWDAAKAALGSAEMEAAGRNLGEIAPGLTTLFVLDPAPDLVPEDWR
jgi:uncharacterized protein (TIGR02118 family)